MIIKKQSKWQYVGEGDGFGLIHTVIQVLGNQIVTWSDIEQGSENEPGYSWSGERDQFVRDFQPVGDLQGA